MAEQITNLWVFFFANSERTSPLLPAASTRMMQPTVPKACFPHRTTTNGWSQWAMQVPPMANQGAHSSAKRAPHSSFSATSRSAWITVPSAIPAAASKRLSQCKTPTKPLTNCPTCFQLCHHTSFRTGHLIVHLQHLHLPGCAQGCPQLVPLPHPKAQSPVSWSKKKFHSSLITELQPTCRRLPAHVQHLFDAHALNTGFRRMRSSTSCSGSYL